MKRDAEYYVKSLNLEIHPEGGAFREIYRSGASISESSLPSEFESGERNFSTAIYFLLKADEFSAFHRIRSDEVWHFYYGDPLEIIEINEEGVLKKTILGRSLEEGELFCHVVPANTWFASRVITGGEFALVGCTVSPGFDFRDFEMAERQKLIMEFPQHASIITELTRQIVSH